MGMLQDRNLDAEIDAVAALPDSRATARWATLDRETMSQYVALPISDGRMAAVVGTRIAGGVGDATLGMLFFPDVYLKAS